jgi:hypothetical protein
MMGTSRRRLWLASLAILCVAILASIYFASIRTVAPTQLERAEELPGQAIAPPDRVNRDEAAAERSRSSSANRIPLSEDSSDPNSGSGGFVTFRYESGEPASGLGLCGSGVGSAAYDLSITNERPNWSLRLGALGELSIERARELGRFVAIRLSEAAVGLLPIDVSKQLEYVLPTVVEQELSIGGMPSGGNPKVEVELQHLVSCSTGSAIDYKNELRGASFSDRFSVQARVLDAPCTLAYARLLFDESHRSVHLRLPVGAYRIGPLHASVGWWVSSATMSVSGAPITIPLIPAPITLVLLKRDASGSIRKPDHVRIYIESEPHDGFAGSSGEVDLDFVISGERLEVGETYRNAAESESFTKYALKLYWPDGTTTMTKVGPWESLLQVVDLSGT